MINRDVRPIEEELKSLGFTETTPGGDRAYAGMVDLLGVPLAAAGEAPKPVTEGAEGSAADEPVDEGAGDPFEAPVLCEELLERLEAMDMDAVDADALVDLVEAIADKQVPAELEARLQAVLAEMKKVRIVGGKVTRVNVRRGSKAMRQKRKRRMEYKRHKAAIKIGRKKRMRKAGAKIKAGKTARKRKSLFGKLKGIVRKAGAKLGGMVKKVKAKVGGGHGLVKSESKLARELDALLSESRVGDATLRDEMVGRIGDILVLLDWILEDDAVAERFCEAYEPVAEAYCAGALTEAKVDEAAFQAQITPVVRMIGKCVDELEGNFGSLA
jgi:hypothetical protein